MGLRQIPQFSFHQSGGSLLTNMLLELGVCIHAETFEEAWHEPMGDVYRLKESFRLYLGTLYPRFMEQDLYCFPSGCSVRFTHSPPLPGDCESRPIHLVRDPRGSMLSVFDRSAQGRTLEEFLNSNCRRDGPKPIPFSLFNVYPAECWALMGSMLEAAFRADPGPGGFLSLRFEELKADPVGQLRRVVDHMGVEASEKSLQAACRRSSKEAIAEATRRWNALYPGRDPEGARTVKRGKTGGWEAHYGPAETRALGAMTHCVMDELGYPCEGQAMRRPRAMAPAPVAAVLRDTVDELRRSSSNSSRLTLGLTIQACLQIQRAFEGQLETAAAEHGLARLRELYSIAEGRALHWLSAADGLWAAGDREGADHALERGAKRATSLGELLDVAHRCVDRGDTELGKLFVERVADTFGIEQLSAWEARSTERMAGTPMEGTPSLLQQVGFALGPKTQRALATGSRGGHASRSFP